MQRFMLVTLLVLSLLPFGMASAHEHHCEALIFANGRAWPSAMMAGSGAVYGTIANPGSTDDTLVSASTDIAEVVELHQSMVNDEGMMTMSPVEGGISVPAGQTVELAPGGLHIMLINLTAELIEGETFEVTLIFENAGEMAVPVKIHLMEEEGMEHEMESAEEHNMHATEEAHMEEHTPVTVLGECEGMVVTGVWARPSVTVTGATYATIFNFTGEDDTLVSATTEAAEVVEIHTMMVGEDDVMTMTPLPDGLPIPANSMAQLKPGGLHFMMINLTDTLDAGESIELTLTFEKAGDITLTVPIEEHDTDMNMEGH